MAKSVGNPDRAWYGFVAVCVAFLLLATVVAIAWSVRELRTRDQPAVNDAIVEPVLVSGLVHYGKPVRVIDGDTVDVLVDSGFGALYLARIRLLGIDAPERWHLGGPASTNHLKELLASGETSTEFKALDALLPDASLLSLTGVKVDKYGGRFDAVIWKNGVSINQKMVDDGFAKPASF